MGWGPSASCRRFPGNLYLEEELYMWCENHRGATVLLYILLASLLESHSHTVVLMSLPCDFFLGPQAGKGVVTNP